MPNEFDQYSSAKPLLAGYPAWIADEQEQKRIAAYQLYEQIYWTVPETFKLLQRGQETQPIYIPSGKTIVETLHRYMANQMRIIVDPERGEQAQQELATQVMTDLVRRERLYSRFSANKRYGIMRGDWAWQILANPLAEVGARISILPIDPASIFPVYKEGEPDTIIGWHVVDQFLDNDGKYRIRRLTYRKTTEMGGPSPITVEEAVFETDAWGGPNMKEEKLVRVLQPPFTLPSPIDHLPIYNIPNFDEPGALWGSSEMRGLESIMAAVNQSISDEELTLAMDGLGVYATNAGAPLDETTGEDAPWDIGPAKVVEVPAESFFNRITGVTSVMPYQEHLKYLHEQLGLGSGTPAIAQGLVDVTVAESGVALTIQMGPMLFKAGEKELNVTDVTTNLLFDLSKWYIAYEGTAFNSLLEATRWVPVYGDKLPVNKQQEFDNIMAMVGAKTIPLTVAWDMLRKLGIELPENKLMQEGIIEETAAMAAIEMEAMAGRISGELDQGGPPVEENQ